MQTLTEIVKGKSTFSHAISGVLYYITESNDEKYLFSIDMNDKNDVGTTTFSNEYKTITLMRWVRRALENGTLIKL